MNTYAKFTANVYVAKCTERQIKGATILVKTKYGKENECIVFNLVAEVNGHFYYSIVRADGFNMQEFAKQKAERHKLWAQSAENKSAKYWEASNEGKDFLSLGEPIKMGHHSEKRHRALIKRNHNRMDKAIKESQKVDQHENKADYWNKKANNINLSMPESVEYYEYKVEEAKMKHEFYKANPEKREHSFSLTYAKKAVNEAEKNFETAKKLWL
jgi:hypothetical protein